LICHKPSWNRYAPLLTPRKDSVKDSVILNQNRLLIVGGGRKVELRSVENDEAGDRAAAELPQLRDFPSECYFEVSHSQRRRNDGLINVASGGVII
jgi:hypothetical protein